MKKIFALALAAVMTAGMATTSFALKDWDVKFEYTDGNNYIVVDRDDDGKFGAGVGETTKDFTYHSSNGKFAGFKKEDGGKKVALPVYDKNGAVLTDEDALKRWNVAVDLAVGELDEKPDFEYVRVNGDYAYAVVFTLPESAELKTEDLGGSIVIYNNSSDKRNPDVGTNKITFGFEYGYTAENLYDIADLTDATIVEFKDKAANGGAKLEGEESLCFGDYFEFEVDVTGQGKLNLKNNVDFNKEFAAMYDYANIDFINFEYEPSFNKNGTAYIFADEDEFVYEVTADGAKAIKGLKWDEDYEAWTFKTRTLKSYAISDVELDEKTVTEDKNESSKPEGDKHNPDTGR